MPLCRCVVIASITSGKAAVPREREILIIRFTRVKPQRNLDAPRG
jgi:hypothetical protein